MKAAACSPQPGLVQPLPTAPSWMPFSKQSINPDIIGARMAQFSMVDEAKRSKVCSLRSQRALPVTSMAIRRCGDDHRDARLLIGILSAPEMQARRDAIRQTWLRWPGEVGHPAVACVVVGRAPSTALRDAVLREQRQHNDMMLLDTDDGCGQRWMGLDKVRAWWHQAAAMLEATPALKHVAKVDDDSFVHVPNLQRELAMLGCLRHLYLGQFAFVGLRPAAWQPSSDNRSGWTQLAVCGFNWAATPAGWLRRGCPSLGFHPPHPFAVGMLEVLSAPLVQLVGRSPDVAAFVRTSAAAAAAVGSERPSSPALRRSAAPLTAAVAHGAPLAVGEDPVLGFWVARLAEASGLDVTYVRVGKRMTDFRCTLPNAGVAHRPLVVHYLKTAGGQRYVHRLLTANATHDASTCAIYTRSAAWRECWTQPGLQCHREATRPPAAGRSFRPRTRQKLNGRTTGT